MRLMARYETIVTRTWTELGFNFDAGLLNHSEKGRAIFNPLVSQHGAHPKCIREYPSHIRSGRSMTSKGNRG